MVRNILCLILFGSFSSLTLYQIYWPKSVPNSPTLQTNVAHVQVSCLTNNVSDGWISSTVYNKLQPYLQNIRAIRANLSRLVHVEHGNYTIKPFKQDYIQWIKGKHSPDYPYSSWQCYNSTNREPNSHEYCLLTNIYYDSSNNKYYFYRNPSESTTKTRSEFMSSHGEIQVNIIDDIAEIRANGVSAILTKPVHIGGAPDRNYAHGFLERCGPLFWVLAEFQLHRTYIDPSRVQLYYSSKMHTDFGANLWQPMKRLPDGTYQHTPLWNEVLYAMFSNYPLITCRSFTNITVLFKELIFTGTQNKRSAAWGIYYLPERPQSYYPFDMYEYRRAYLAYSEWILNNFELPSKFELTNIQKKLQDEQKSENIPICYKQCQYKSSIVSSTTGDEFTGEWIVVLNRAGVGRREISNADELVEALLKAFPDHENPYLRVWPKQFNFNDDLYATARMARSIRLLIGVHGAGLSNTIFMRPGTILYEINPPGCRELSFNFRRWAVTFNLQHALWSPGDKGTHCLREGSTTVNVNEVVSDVIDLIQDERHYRSGYLSRALQIITNENLPGPEV